MEKVSYDMAVQSEHKARTRRLTEVTTEASDLFLSFY